MQQYENTLTATGGINASSNVLLILMKALAISGCKLEAYKLSGNLRPATLEFTVAGQDAEIKLFEGVISGWSNS